MSSKKSFVGFGFGPIQGGLFLLEAFRSGNFNRFVVAEVVPDVVDAVRRSGGRFHVNIATPTGIEKAEIGPIEIFNPVRPNDRQALVEAVATADELATALPSVKFYGKGEPGSVVDILAEGFRLRQARKSPTRSILYTGENHNHAAEILHDLVSQRLGADAESFNTQVHILNTVIGKMSGAVTDAAQIAEQSLLPIVPGIARCFLVERFNHILITKIRWADFPRGIPAFVEKPDLLPFEEAKLYGHNATHALIGYLARLRGRATVSDIRQDPDIQNMARAAFLEESGRALCAKHAGLDPLFTEAGYRAYAEDLLERMMNPHLRDAVSRVVRDPQRKLGWDDRLVGTMRLALRQGIRPTRYALGAAAALQMLQETDTTEPAQILDQLWPDAAAAEKPAVKQLILDSQAGLAAITMERGMRAET
ncbi:MAG: hypothetical protein HY343_07300 [Lentisphaerae bacterium]|nr:hypothetical protein [Lentisphaerota bacterium]